MGSYVVQGLRKHCVIQTILYLSLKTGRLGSVRAVPSDSSAIMEWIVTHQQALPAARPMTAPQTHA